MDAHTGLRRMGVRDYIVRISTLLLATMAIVWSFPREKTVGYDYDVGHPWKYSQLIASFDFPIRKSDKVVRQERDSVKRNFQPYYTSVPGVAKQQLEQMRADFAHGPNKGMPHKCLAHLEKTLREIYAQGVVNAEEMRAMTDSGISAIRIVDGTQAVSRQLKETFSTRTAYEYLIHADTVDFPPETLYRCNLNNYVAANLKYDETRSADQLKDLLGSVSFASGMVQTGEKIIDRGEIVTQHTYNILKSFEAESKERNESENETHTIFMGQLLYVGILLSMLFFYLALFRKDYFDKGNSLLLMISLVVLYPVATALLTPGRSLIQYVIPFAMTGIFVRIFTDSRTAFMVLAISILTSAPVVPDPFEFIVVQLTGGSIAIYSLRELTRRSQLLRTAFVSTIGMGLVALSFDLFQGTELASIDISMYFSLMFNGILLLFAYPMLFMVEKTFGFTSDVTLIELSNINNPLLREMSKLAQGTFNHSLQVANLASEVANKIGAKAQLVRTGALYHDIGKMQNPAFFTENQHGRNPHEGLSEKESAAIIISHVADGLRLAEKYRLPKDVRAFIATHHGRSKAKYFYVTYVNKHPGEKIDEAAFTYPGPNPYTREQAILMMADSVEAASRSLKEYTDTSIRELVNHIVDGQMKEGYFLNCPITFKDIATAKEVLIENLKTIYHTRISYPELNKDDDADDCKQHTLGSLIKAGLRRNKQ